MPLYEYKCLECNHVIEKIKSSDTLETCPVCGSEMRRRWGSFSIRGFFHWMDWGKHDKLVSYPGGKVRVRKYNERD